MENRKKISLNIHHILLSLVLIFYTNCGSGSSKNTQGATPIPTTRQPGWGKESTFPTGQMLVNSSIKFTNSGKCFCILGYYEEMIYLGTMVSDDTWESEQVMDNPVLYSECLGLTFDANENPIVIWNEYDTNTAVHHIKSRRKLPSGWEPIHEFTSVYGIYSNLEGLLITNKPGQSVLVTDMAEVINDNGNLVFSPVIRNAYVLDSQGNWGDPILFKSTFIPSGNPYTFSTDPIYPPIPSILSANAHPYRSSVAMAGDGNIYFFWTAYVGSSLASQWFARWNPSMPEIEIKLIDAGSNQNDGTALSIDDTGEVRLVWNTDYAFAPQNIKTCKYNINTGLSSIKILDSVPFGFPQYLLPPRIININSVDYIFWITGVAQGSVFNSITKGVKSINSNDFSPISIIDQYQGQYILGDNEYMPHVVMPKQDGNIWLAGNYQGAWVRICTPDLSLGGITTLSSAISPDFIQDGPVLATHSSGKSVIAWNEWHPNKSSEFLHIRMYK